ncbi:hypothetical protein KEJ34_00020 [Candidatus Bathyarchaeota archaeon]|nr:hypothetical protein [Candidatus Bathyarchaeota archaeon]
MGTKRIVSVGLAVLLLLSLAALFFSVSTSPHLMIVEWSIEHSGSRITLYQISSEDNSNITDVFKLLPFHWYATAEYYINPKNKYGFSTDAVVSAITAAVNTWDSQTSAAVFSYKGTTSRSAGKRDGYNVIDWGPYRAGVIAVTYIWYVGDMIIETDTRMNTYYKWSLSGEAKKMDVQNIMTHEFGHWCGLDDLYDAECYWLTMYGYADYGETYKRTLGLGDILGLKCIYGE